MEFPFNCERALNPDSEGYSLIDAYTLKRWHSNKQAAQIIDTMGELSAKAQTLKSVITTTTKLLEGGTRMYAKVAGNTTIGFLKVGIRNLFIRDNTGKIFEISPLCVLDFYVHETVQRSGNGKKLFEVMLANEKTTPERLAYDRPSPKLLAFMKRHYSLADYIPQNNNYVVYNKYFSSSGKSFTEVNYIKGKETTEIKIGEKPSFAQIGGKLGPVVPKDIYEGLAVLGKMKQESLPEEAKASKSSGSFPRADFVAKPSYKSPTMQTSSSAYGAHYSYQNH